MPTEGLWGILLAGAYPRGMLALDRLLPRPLLPVADAPVITYPLLWLSDTSVSGVTACVNSAARAVRSVLEDTPRVPRPLEFYEDWMPRGPAGCVRDAGLRTDALTFVVVDGTTIPHPELQSLVADHHRQGAALTLAVHAEQDGVVGRRLSPDGIYVIERRALDYVAEHGFQDIKEGLIPRLYAAGERVAFHECQRACPRIYDFDSYLAVNRWAISGLAREPHVPEGYERRGEAFVHATSRVSRFARLIGPLMVGPGVTVDDYATLVGPTAIGSGSLVARGAVVSRSVLWNNCQLGADSVLDRCLLADGALVPPRASLYGRLSTGSVPQPVRLRGPSTRPSPAQAVLASVRPLTRAFRA
jgi:NDP-sugar pyrophosphorylase family protein